MRRRSFLTGAGTLLAATHAGCLGDQQDDQNGDTLDPTDDVDGDGFTVCQERNVLESAEVGRMDIFVELDWIAGARPNRDSLERLVDVYDEAPVEASHGAEEGINLHIEYGTELPAQDEPVSATDIQQFAHEHFEHDGYGYHYAVFVEQLQGGGLGWTRDGLIAVQAAELPEEFSTLQIFAHELGHSLGLDRDVFEGIDSHDTPFEEYPSIMNYAAIHDIEAEHLDFSDGTNSEGDFDDWEYIQDNIETPDTGELASAEACE